MNHKGESPKNLETFFRFVELTKKKPTKNSFYDLISAVQKFSRIQSTEYDFGTTAEADSKFICCFLINCMV